MIRIHLAVLTNADPAALILLVDDDREAASLLADAFAQAGYDFRMVKSGEEALAEAERRQPGIVLVETKLPGLSGYTVCRELKSRYGADFPVIFVSGSRTESYDRVAGLLMGADDYLVKPFDPDEVVARVRRFVSPSHTSNDDDRKWELTPREQEVLDLLAEGQHEAEIAKALFITRKTVATHIQRILSKLGVHSRAQAVALVYTSASESSR